MASLLKSGLLATQSDARLLRLARGGSEPAFQALVDRYRRPLLRHCRQLCLSQVRAEEVLQATLSEAWSKLRSDSRQLEDVQRWLQGIAQKLAAKAMRETACVESPNGGASELQGGAASGGASLPNPDEVLALRGALAAMSSMPPRRMILVDGAADQARKRPEQHLESFEIADSAVWGLLRRAREQARDGITALTPPPLLAWALGRVGQGSPAGGTQVAELTSGGGAGLAGLAVKAGIAAITAGVAITGSVVLQGNGKSHMQVRRRGVGGAPATLEAGAGGALQRALWEVAGANLPRRHGARGLDGVRPAGAISHPRLGGGEGGVVGGTGAPTEASSTAPTRSTGASQPSSSSRLPSTGGGGVSAGGVGVAAAAGTSPGSAPSASVQASLGGESSGQESSVGVQMSIGGSQQATAAGSASSGSGSAGGSRSQGTEVGLAVSLGPLRSAGAQVSLP